MAGSWSHVPGDKYKTTNNLIHTLVDIVAKGGNLLLNIGPDASGNWDDTAYTRLQEIGNWMKINSSCIYNSTAVAPYKSGRFCFTQVGKTIYAIYLLNEGETTATTLNISNYIPFLSIIVKIIA